MIIESVKRILKRFRSDKILNKIGSGKIVYFENPLEAIAIKYLPGEPGKVGKYYAKHYGRNEYEIDFNSSCVVMGVMEGKRISRAKYFNYHLIESFHWNRALNNSVIELDYDILTKSNLVPSEPDSTIWPLRSRPSPENRQL
jgi:hypothetical protein